MNGFSEGNCKILNEHSEKDEKDNDIRAPDKDIANPANRV